MFSLGVVTYLANMAPHACDCSTHEAEAGLGDPGLPELLSETLFLWGKGVCFQRDCSITFDEPHLSLSASLALALSRYFHWAPFNMHAVPYPRLFLETSTFLFRVIPPPPLACCSSYLMNLWSKQVPVLPPLRRSWKGVRNQSKPQVCISLHRVSAVDWQVSFSLHHET